MSKGDSVHRYEALVKAFETDDYYFLYITSNQAYLIDKHSFTIGTPDELRHKLREKLGDRFKERHS